MDCDECVLRAAACHCVGTHQDLQIRTGLQTVPISSAVPTATFVSSMIKVFCINDMSLYVYTYIYIFCAVNYIHDLQLSLALLAN